MTVTLLITTCGTDEEGFGVDVGDAVDVGTAVGDNDGIADGDGDGVSVAVIDALAPVERLGVGDIVVDGVCDGVGVELADGVPLGSGEQTPVKLSHVLKRVSQHWPSGWRFATQQASVGPAQGFDQKQTVA